MRSHLVCSKFHTKTIARQKTDTEGDRFLYALAKNTEGLFFGVLEYIYAWMSQALREIPESPRTVWETAQKHGEEAYVLIKTRNIGPIWFYKLQNDHKHCCRNGKATRQPRTKQI